MKRLIVALLITLFASTSFAASLGDVVLDGALNIVKNGGTTVVFCSAEPTTYGGVAAVTLATKTGLTSGSYTGPADHTSGRKITVAAQTAITPSANGTVTRACITNGSSILYGCANVTSQAVTTTQTWNSPAVIIAITDPS
jgi:hypothetical protein